MSTNHVTTSPNAVPQRANHFSGVSIREIVHRIEVVGLKHDPSGV